MRLATWIVRRLLGLFGSALLGVLLILLVSVSALGWVWFTLPPVAELKSRYPVVNVAKKKGDPPVVVIEDRRPAGWTSYSEIPRAVIGAVVVSEDGSFFQHDGFDPEAVKAAIREDLERRSFAFGGSTITQQVIKNVYLHKQKSLIRKIKEFYLAFKLDEAVEKKRILEVYFNIVELGDGVFGIRQAARHYFQKSPADLNPKEGAFLAMLLPSPKKYSVSFRKQELTRYAQRTIRSLLSRMAQAGYLTAEERDLWNATPLSFEKAAKAESAPLEPSESLDPTAAGTDDETVTDSESE